MFVPFYEDIGNVAKSVESDVFFGTIAKGLVDSFIEAEIFTQETMIPTSPEAAMIISPDPFEVMRNAVKEIGLQPSLDAIQYRVHYALHILWVKTYGYTTVDGENLRHTLTRNFATFDNYNNEQAKIEAAGAN